MANVATTDILAQLRDIHVPKGAAWWWPLAPGWYLLFILVLCVSGIFFYRIRVQYVQHIRPKRYALKYLAASQQQSLTTQAHCIAIMDILRRVALVYYPRKRVAQLYGDAWITFLQETSHDLDFSIARDALVEYPYRSESNLIHKEVTFVYRLACAWIKQRGRVCLN